MPESNDNNGVPEGLKISLQNAADCLSQNLVPVEELVDLLRSYLYETFPDFCENPEFVEWKAREVVDFFKQAADAFFAFDEEGHLIGFAGAQLFDPAGHPNGLQPIEIRSVAVSPHARGLGVSKRLIAELEASVLDLKRFPQGVVLSMTSHEPRIIDPALKNGYEKLKPDYSVEEAMAITGLPRDEIMPASYGWTILVKEQAPQKNISEVDFSDRLLNVVERDS